MNFRTIVCKAMLYTPPIGTTAYLTGLVIDKTNGGANFLSIQELLPFYFIALFWGYFIGALPAFLGGSYYFLARENGCGALRKLKWFGMFS